MPTQESTLRVGVDSRPMVTGARKGERALDGLGERAGSVGAIFTKLSKNSSVLGLAFAALASVGIAQFFNSAVQAAGSFETAMAEVSTLVNETTFDLQQLESAILSQSRAFGQTPVAQAAAGYQIISAGASSASEAILLLDASNKLAIGGVTDVATAADGLTSVLNAYGKSAEDATDVSDALFVAMRAGKTTIGEMSSSLGKVAPLAAQAGVTFDELVASVAALTKGGISTSESVTGVRAIIAAVVKPTKEAVDQAASLGLSFDAASLKAQGFAGFIGNVVEATGGSSESMAQLFGGVEALIPALALAGQVGIDMSAILSDMATKGGATQAAFEKMTNTFEFQAGRLRTSLTTAMIELGAILNSVLTPTIKFLADNFDALTRFVSVAAIGITASLIPAFIALVPAVASATTGLIAMAAAWLLTPFGAIQALIVGAAAALAYFGDTNVEVAGRVASVWQVFKALLMTVGDAFTRAGDLAKKALSFISEKLTGLTSTIAKLAKLIASGASAAWEIASAAASDFFLGITKKINDFLSVWGLSLNTLGSWISESLGFFSGLFDSFLSTVGVNVSEGLPSLFRQAMNKAHEVARIGLQDTINLFVKGLGMLGDLLDHIPGFDGVGDAIRESLTVDFSDLALTVEDVEAAIIRTGQALASDFGANLDAVTHSQESFNAALESSLPIVDAVTEQVTQLSEAQKDYIEGLQDEFEQIAIDNGGARESVQKWYEEQKQILDDLGLSYETYGQTIEVIFNERMKEAREKDLENATDWASGIERAVNSIGEEIGSVADQAEKAFKSAFDKSADALATFVTTGKLDFADLARSVIADLARMQAKALLFQGLQSTFGGGFGNFTSLFPNFATGGSFMVGGTGGVDSQFVGMNVSPNERVTIETPAQQRQSGGGGVYIELNFDARGADPTSAAQSRKAADDLRRDLPNILTSHLLQLTAENGNVINAVRGKT